MWLFMWYIVSEILRQRDPGTRGAFSDRDVYQTVRQAVHTAHGDYGLGCLLRSLTVKYLNTDTGIVYIRARRGAHKMVQSAIVFVKEIAGEPAFFRTLHLAGTLRSCNKFMIQYYKQQLPRLLQACTTDEERKTVQAALHASCVAVRRQLGIVERTSPDTD